MPKAYSLDLRQKIVDAYDRGDISQRGLANQFGVAKSFVQKLLKQRRDTNSIAPKVREQQTQPKLTAEHRAILAELVEANNDATLEELCDQVEQQTGVRVGTTTMHNTLKQLELTVKKKRSTQTLKLVSGCKQHGSRFGRRSQLSWPKT